jgi:exopolyphosphatase/guanosine-5'-triphosphate,3'-diphosphate pyrophosphatase
MTNAAARPSTTPAPGERLAAIDVGSNSVRLIIAEYDPPGTLRIIDEVKDQPRLAGGLAATGQLSDEAMARAVQVLRRMKEVTERRGVRRLRAVATAAIREAANGAEFVKRIQKEVGLSLEVIDADTEAALSYRSVAHHFPLGAGRALVADIGGGSLELIGAVNGLVELTTSLPLGAVRLTDQWLDLSESLPDQISELRGRVRKRLRKAFDRVQWINAMVIGSGGTFTNLGRMARARRGHDPAEAVHGEVVTTAEVEQLLEWLSTKTSEERCKVPGLNPQRADIILAGLAVTAELLQLVDARGVTVSAFGLREGLLLDMVGKNGTLAADPLVAIRDFVDRCQVDRRHVEQVRLLALTLFDRLQETLGAEDSERFLLEAASLLHDVGQVVSYRKHHKHSYQLILHAERLSLNAHDRLLIALVSRYHRKKGPSKKHEEFARLSSEDRAVVRRLSGILRVADGLDRGHTAAVDHLMTRLSEDTLTIRVAPKTTSADLSLEIWGAARKADVLEEVLDRQIRFVTMRRNARA